jgi:phosphohistidine phosphatase
VRLILMRHADAGDPDPARWPDDRQRPLTPDGAARHRQVALALRRMGVTFDEILTSPLARARQTAEIVAEVYGCGRKVEAHEALADRAAPADVLTPLAARDPGGSVLVVGHEPNLSRLAAALISRDGSARLRLEKGGLLVVDFDGPPAAGQGVLRLHLRPDELLALAGSP